MPNQNFELRSEEIQEVLRRVPPVVNSWGPAALFVVLLLLGGTAYFIKVPDRISGSFLMEEDRPGQLYINSEKTGLIRSGQTMLIELDNYPVSQFGLLEAKVDSLIYDEKQEQYAVRIAPIKELHTSYGQVLDPLPNMSGAGTIILAEERLLFRFLPFLAMISTTD